MASNTSNGPAGNTGPAMGVKPHQTFNKTAKEQKDGFNGSGAPGSNTPFNGQTGPIKNV